VKSIFINIAGYHDYELPKTINNLIQKSSGKYNLFFGVHSVFENKDNIDIPALDNIRYISSKAPANLSPGVGRYMAHTLYNNEDYYMVIDSHSRFIENWDDILVNDIIYYQSIGHEKPVLTCYPAMYEYDEFGNEILFSNDTVGNIVFKTDEESIKTFKEFLNIKNKVVFQTSKYQKSISGGFTFTVYPYINLNKYIGFEEEFAVGAMLYTNGFDLLVPSILPIYHYYSDPRSGTFEQYNRRGCWQYKNNLDNLYKIGKESKDTIYNMFNENIIGKYHLGTQRTLAEYAEYAGLNFKNREIL
jgi:hypothetical protein